MGEATSFKENRGMQRDPTQKMKFKVYDFQNRHLNLLFWGIDAPGVGVRGWGDACLASSSESGGVGNPDTEEIWSSGCVIMLSFDRRVVLPDETPNDDGG